MSYCNWEHTSDLNIKYHDEEWGIPLHDDTHQFEFLSLEVLQCGLNWNIIINKREIFRTCFHGFDFTKIALYTENDIKRIMLTEGMIKSPKKISAIINNAQCFKQIINQFGSFDSYLWGFSNHKTILYKKHAQGFIPVSNGLSENISRNLKKRGFKFLGPITIYSHLQACGIINDHDQNCPRFTYINAHFPTICQNPDHEVGVHNFGTLLKKDVFQNKLINQKGD